MIGHYLLTLTTEQEDRVLTRRMGYAPFYVGDGCCCLLGTVLDDWTSESSRAWAEYAHCRRPNVGRRYDKLCERFGDERLNAAIRNRILANRARRVLGAPVESAVVGSAA